MTPGDFSAWRRPALAALVLVGLWTAFLLHWHRRDARPPQWDQSIHLHLALDYRALLLRGEAVTSPWASYYPPLYHWALMPALAAQAVPSEAAAVPVNAAFLALMFAGLLMLCVKGGLPPGAGVVAGLAVLGGPFVTWAASQALIDVPLMGWVTLSMGLLWLTDGFRRRGSSWAWGAASGMGLLLKHTFGLFMLLPAIAMLARGRRSTIEVPRGRHLVGGLILIVWIGLSWYWWNAGTFLPKAFGNAVGAAVAEGDPAVWTWASLTHYAAALPRQLGGPMTLFLAAGVPFFVRRHRRSSLLLLLVSWILSGYVLLTLIPNKDARYTFPLLPAFALMGVAGWWELRPGRGLRAAVALGVAGLAAWNLARFERPVPDAWQHVEIGRLLAERRDPDAPFLQVAVLANHDRFFGRTLRWTLRARGLDIEGSSAGRPLTDFSEFVIFKSGNLGPGGEEFARHRAGIERSGRAFHKVFRPAGRFPLPDGTEALVFHRDAGHRFAVAPLRAAVVARKLEAWARTAASGPVRVRLAAEPGGLTRGRIQRAVLEGDLWKVRGLPIRRPRLEASGLWLNLYRLWEGGQPGILALREVRLRAEVEAADVAALLERRVKGLRDVTVDFQDGRLAVRGRWRGVPVAAAARVRLDPAAAALRAELSSLSIGRVPLPGRLLGRVAAYSLPLRPTPSFPVTLRLSRLELQGGRLRIE